LPLPFLFRSLHSRRAICFAHPIDDPTTSSLTADGVGRPSQPTAAFLPLVATLHSTAATSLHCALLAVELRRHLPLVGVRRRELSPPSPPFSAKDPRSLRYDAALVHETFGRRQVPKPGLECENSTRREAGIRCFVSRLLFRDPIVEDGWWARSMLEGDAYPAGLSCHGRLGQVQLQRLGLMRCRLLSESCFKRIGRWAFVHISS
jgi:hypothetical protein